jgi:hypothetical protein
MSPGPGARPEPMNEAAEQLLVARLERAESDRRRHRHSE